MRVIVGDVETTGKSDPKGVVEIAWIEIDENLDVIGEVVNLIDPQMPIGYGAIAVHGIYPKDVESAPTLEEFFSLVKPDYFASENVCLVGHNVQFDRPFFARGVKGTLSTICTLRLAKVFLPESQEFNLGALAVEYQLGRGTAHRALGDCHTTLNLLRLIQQRDGRSVMDMYIEASAPRLIKYVPMGKHKGTLMVDLDKGWATWALREIKDLDIDFKYSLEQRLAK